MKVYILYYITMKVKSIIFDKTHVRTLPIQVNVWIPKEYIEHIQLFLKKIIDTIQNKNIKTKWETYESYLFPPIISWLQKQ